MGPHFEKYEDLYSDQHKQSVFENREVAWQGLQETEKRQRQEYERALQKERDSGQLRYQAIVKKLQKAIYNYHVQKTKNCLVRLTQIDNYQDFELWRENRLSLRLYIRNALECAAQSHQIPEARQIADELRIFDRTYMSTHYKG